MKCKVVCDFDLNVNNKSLNYLYMPIIGIDSINLYNLLINENEISKNMYNGATFELNDLVKKLKMKNIEEFNKFKSMLEAMNLLSTFIDQNKNDLLVFKILNPLNWLEFKENKNYINLLKSRISPNEFERTKYAFDGNNETIGLINVSATFESVFNDIELEEFDVNALYDDLFKLTHNLVSIDDQVIAKIKSLFLKNEISYSEILNCCYKSIYCIGNKLLVDQKILDIKINELIKSKNICEYSKIIELNRNLNLFLNDMSKDEMNKIINNYQIINSEQYLACSQKEPINELESKTIAKLRNNYHLPDFIINILLDYCIVVNSGRIEPIYLQKIAITINRLNLKNPELIINHLKSALKHRNKMNNKQVNNYKGIDW